MERTYVTRQELKEACERALDIYPIGMRTIDADIHAMRHDAGLGYHAPIAFDRINRAYYYDDPNYSIDNIPLNEEELNSIVFAGKLLEQFKGMEILNTFTGSVQKLMDAINIYRQNNAVSYPDYIEFEKADEAKGTEYIEPVMDALKNRRVLHIEYRTFSARKNKMHIIHPYLLKEYRNRWYLIGYHDTDKDIRTYSLDRFVSLSADDTVTFVDTGFDAKEYYRNVIGISVLNKDPVEIHIAFTPFQAQYVITQPLHHSQELVSETKDRIVFRYFLVPNFEFYAQILGWGDEVEILKPEKVRKNMLSICKGLTGKYSNTK